MKKELIAAALMGMAFLSGCATSKHQELTREEWLATTTRTYEGIDREKITNVYIKDVGDVISSTMVFDVDGNIVLSSLFDDYLENDCLIKFIDYNWIGDENGN